MAKYKTQKAQGLYFLSTLPFLNEEALFDKPGIFVNDNDNPDSAPSCQIRVWPHHHPPKRFPFFVRPCPVKPRHGFVESREVKNQRHLLQVVMETYGAEKDAEIIFMPRLTGKFSFVATPNTLVIGEGNDGATAGKGIHVRITVPTPNPFYWNVRWLGERIASQIKHDKKMEAGQKEVAYLEGVEDHGRMRLVQARLGPPVPGHITDYVPKEMQVTSVFAQLADQDLLQWEKDVQEWAKVPGLVVWAPGSSLSSHYAVHCIQSGVAYVTGPEPPKVGDTLTVQAPPKMTKKGRDGVAAEIKARLATGYKIPFRSHVREASLAMAVVHAQSVWGNDFLSTRLRARGFLNLIRYSATACIGENRHFGRSGPGRPAQPLEEPGDDLKYVHEAEKRDSLMDWTVIPLTNKPWNTVREQCYSLLHDLEMEELLRHTEAAIVDLAEPGWVPGMGGDKWAEAARHTVLAWNALRAFLVKPGKEEWQALCMAMNVLAFSVHNNGQLLSKFMDYFINIVPQFPIIGLAGAAPILLEEVTGEVVKMDRLETPAKLGKEDPFAASDDEDTPDGPEEDYDTPEDMKFELSLKPLEV